MTEKNESDTCAASAHPAHRTTGQSLVEAFRLARIAQRPALRTELQAARLALRQDRAKRLGRGQREADPAPPPAETPVSEPAPAAGSSIPDAQDAGRSIFAGYCGAQDQVRMETPRIAVDDEPAAPPIDTPEETHAAAPAPPALPLSAIGFGPGMTIRMRQIGIETVSDLAATDPDFLRTTLGDISQLINVELWIASARTALAAQTRQGSG